MEIKINVDDGIYKLAKEWYEIDRKNPPPSLRNGITQEKQKLWEKHQKLWEEFVKRHNLKINQKPIDVFGMKEKMWKVKDRDKLQLAFDILVAEEKAKKLFKGGK